MPFVAETKDGLKVYVLPKDHRPAHVHVYWPRKKNWEAAAKLTIEDAEVMESEGFSKNDLKQIVEFIRSRKNDLKEAWNELEGEEN